MILLELTEKETDVLRMGLIELKDSLEDLASAGASKTSLEKQSTACNSIWAKLDLASQPKQEVLITSKDLHYLKSLANSEYKSLSHNTYLSKKKVEERDFVHISVANALLMWLNSGNLLKNLVRFDFTDNSNEYEGNEE